MSGPKRRSTSFSAAEIEGVGRLFDLLEDGRQAEAAELLDADDGARSVVRRFAKMRLSSPARHAPGARVRCTLGGDVGVVRDDEDCGGVTAGDEDRYDPARVHVRWEGKGDRLCCSEPGEVVPA